MHIHIQSKSNSLCAQTQIVLLLFKDINTKRLMSEQIYTYRKIK